MVKMILKKCEPHNSSLSLESKTMKNTVYCFSCGSVFSFDKVDIIKKLTANVLCPSCSNKIQLPARYMKD